MISFIGSIVFTTCIFHGKSTQDKVSDIKEEYMAACEKDDYEGAREIVKRMQAGKVKGDLFNLSDSDMSQGDMTKSIDEAVAYINDKEIYNLLSHPSRDNDNRIAFLYDSYPAEQLPDMEDVVEVAVSKGNEYLADKLIRAGVGVNTKIAKAAISANMDQMFPLIVSKDPSVILDQEVNRASRKLLDAELYEEYVNKALDSELQNLYDVELPVQPANGKVSYSDSFKSKEYSKEIEKFNNRCYTLILRGVDLGNIEFANKVLRLMRPTLTIKENVGENTYQVTECQDQINQARKIINGASR